MQAWFTKFAQGVSKIAGHPSAFVCAVALIVVWAASGFFFAFSETWQLIINTTTTIITFLMVFVVQNTQNRDTEAMQIKLDELICMTKGANRELLDLEELDEGKLDKIRARYEEIAERARESGKGDPAS